MSAYLNSKSVDHTSVSLVSGGHTNYVYRVTLPSGETTIYKHAAGYSKSNKNLTLDASRMDYEDRVLAILPPLLQKQIPDSYVHAVGRRSYDREHNLLCLDDGGERELKKAYTDSRLDIENIGREMGKWIAAVHTCSTQASLSFSDAQDLQANNPIAVHIYRYSYDHLHEAFAQYGQDVELAKYINEEFGGRLTTENECICHGDFWPGNVLVNFKDGQEKDVDLTLVDWEITRRGISATDVGQFAAEAFLLDRFRGNRGLLPVFLNAYLDERKESSTNGAKIINKEWVRRMVVHWAVHIAYWPTWIEWTDREGTQKLVDIGVSVMKAAVDGDWERLSASELLKHTGGAWAEVWER